MTDNSAGRDSGLRWSKSSFSDDSDSNECVEVAATPATVHVRDSKNPEGPRLAFAVDRWADFVAYASRR